MFKEKLPTFVQCEDGKFYEDLVYQDSPLRRQWFICFDDKEPAELVIRDSAWKKGLTSRQILKSRIFDYCIANILPGRRDPHMRFFGSEINVLTGEQSPVEGHRAISYFLTFKKGVRLPTPKGNDSCVEIYPFFPNKPGVYFGDYR